MGASKCITLAKYILVFTGIIYLISAGGLSYIGIWVFSTYDHYDEIADSSLTLLPASIILAISALMCIIGILACLAACKRSKKLLSVFFCLILMVLLGEISAGALGFVYRSKVEAVLKEDLMDAINNYNVTVYREQIDYMQEEFSCCGVQNASDWLSSTYWRQNHSDTVPSSCCKSNQTCTPKLGSQNIYYDGCLSKLDQEFNKNLVYVISAAVFLALVQLLALLSACILVCRITEERQYQTLADQSPSGWRV
ncbi:unnamed protein product [Candidula unifasciata]|uniref:Tetraspanin n=1 Tax=Candidula unifasciata TaxID=100452 RepID=A0A8S4A8J1_9EUPU|nr:unnamed protein product [Candidula unifasciata]